MLSPEFWWVIAGIVLMVCEFAVPGLILFFFGIGALVTALLTWLLPLNLTTQLMVFIIASLVTLFTLRRFLKPIFMGRTGDAPEEDALAEGMVGQTALVTEAVAPGTPGKVTLNGVAWKAESKEELEAGDRVVVTGQDSLTLIVKSKNKEI